MFAVIWDGLDAKAPCEADGWGSINDSVYIADYSSLSGWVQIGDTVVPRSARGPRFEAGFAASLREVAKHHTAGKQLTHLTILVHGFDFDPVDVTDDALSSTEDPRSGVFAPPGLERRAGESWLPIFNVRTPADADLAPLLCFCWRSNGDFGLASFSNYYQHAVLDLAPAAARSLAATIVELAEAGITLDILAHSLGTRVVMKALAALPEALRATAVRRIVLMNGAEFSIDALAAMRGVGADVFNLVSRRDSFVLKTGAQDMMMPFRAPGRQAWVIGYNGMLPQRDWIDIALDPDVGLGAKRAKALKEQQAAALARLGGFTLNTQGDGQRGPHWSTYRRPENQAFLQALLSRPGWTPQFLRSNGLVEGFEEPTSGAAQYADISGIPMPPVPCTHAERQQRAV